MSEPRTLHIDTGREMHGGQWQVLYLLEGLKNAVLLAPGDSALLKWAKKKGIDARPYSLGSLRDLSRSVDLIHAHDARGHTLAAVFTGGKPLIVSRRVAFPIKRGFFSRWKYAKTATYLAVSQFVARRLKDAGIPGQKIRVVYDGVPIPREPPQSVAGRVVALSSKYIETPGLEVEFINELWRDLSTASVFVYMSKLEGLGSAVLAAMASGVPVVACSQGGISEAIEHGRTGLLVKQDEIAEAVRGLLAEPVKAAEMGLRGREAVADRFSIEIMRAKTLQAYSEVLD